MDKAKKDFAVNLLRRGSYKWEARTIAKRAAKISHGLYRCAICKEETRAKDINLDHITPVKDVRGHNQSIDETVERMFVDASEWQVLCKGCHGKKTNIENTCRDEIEASIKKMNKELKKLMGGQ